jgi:hypothetical protein
MTRHNIMRGHTLWLAGALVAAMLTEPLRLGFQPRSGQALAQWGARRTEYDGRLTFVRLRWTTGTFAALPRGSGVNFWLHEFPGAEQNLMAMVNDLTLIDARRDRSLNLALDDPQLFRYPIAMMWEPGFWVMTDRQAERLREYMQKGGFLIFNDFELEQWDNFHAQSRRIVPGARWQRLDKSHPIFNAFFRVVDPEFPHPAAHHLYGLPAQYFGLYEDNDPGRRLMAIANYNTNLAEYWQMAGSGFFPIDPSNEAFKLGINYLIYALTH